MVTDLCKQQEGFTPATAEIASTFGVQYDADAHGDSGPIQVTYSPFFYADTRKDQFYQCHCRSRAKQIITENIVDATKELGLTVPEDQAAGSPIGGYFCPHNIDPTTVTRSSAREAYYNPIQNRTNLNIITGQSVTKLIVENTNGTAVVTGVEVSIFLGLVDYAIRFGGKTNKNNSMPHLRTQRRPPSR